MTNKKRKRYDFGGYIDTIRNPEASMQQDVLKAATKTAELNNSVWLQGLDVVGNTLIDAGVNGMVGAVGSMLGTGGALAKASKAPKGVTFKSDFEKAKLDRANTNTQQDIQTPEQQQQGKRAWTKKEGLMNLGVQLGGGLLKALPYFFAQGGVAGEEHNVEHVPIEAEGGEMIAMPWDNQAMPIEGASHENGGVDMTVPVGSKIYSKRVKDAKGKSMAYRKERRDRELKKWEKIVKDDPNNQIAKDTLEKVRRNNEIEEANDMAYMQLHKAKKQFSDYIKDVTKDYGKGGGLNIAAARQAIDQHNMQPVQGEREQYFTGAYVKRPDYAYLGKWNTLHTSQEPLTIDTVQKYISSRLPGFKFNGLFNSEPTQGSLNPEQEKYFWEEIVPFLDYHAYMNDPSKIIAEGKNRNNITGSYQAQNFNYTKYKKGIDNAFKGLDPIQYSGSKGLNNNNDIPLIISERLQKLQELGQLNIPNPKQANVNQDQNFNSGKYQNAIQDNLETPSQITQSQQRLANLGISNIPNSNKINSTPTTPNYQALQYNQANYEKTLRDAFKGVDTNQFSDSTGSSTDSDVPPTIRQAQQNLANIGVLKSINMFPASLQKGIEGLSQYLNNPESRLKGIWDIKPPADNQASNTSTDSKAKATKQVQNNIGLSYRPGAKPDIQTLAALINHNDPRDFALFQNINNNTPTKPTAKGKQANTVNTTTQVTQPQVTQQDIEELRKRLPKTITMNGRSYNTDALLNMLNQNPLAGLALGQNISSNDATSKGSGKSTNKSQGKDISNVNPDYIDKLIQSGWNPLFGFTGGVPNISNNDTDNATNTANTSNEVSSNNRYNPNNFSYSPDYMADMLGLNKDAKTGKYYDPRTGQEISDSILTSFGTSDATGQSQQSNIVSSTSNTTTEQNSTGQNTGTTPLATVPSVTTNTGENTNTNIGKGIFVQPTAVGSGVNNATPVVPNNTVIVGGGGNTATVPATTSYINGDKIDYKSLISNRDNFRALTGNIADSIFRKANSIPANDDLTGNNDVKALQVDIMTTINTANDNGSTVPQLRAKLAKVLSKREIFSGQTDGKSKPLTDAIDTIISSLAGTGSKQDNTKQGNTTIQASVKGKDTNTNIKNENPKEFSLKFNEDGTVNKESFEDFQKLVKGNIEENKKQVDSLNEDDTGKEGNTKEGNNEEGDETTEKPNLWSVLSDSLNPAFGTQFAGILHNMIKPMKTAEDNFKAKQRYKNNYRDYGKKSLLELDKMKDNLQQLMQQNINELESQRVAQTYINNNSARDINVARALNLAGLSKTMDATNRVYANQASLQNNIHQVRANMLSNIDNRVMGEDRNTQTLNNQLIDSYFNNKATADMIFGTGLQNIGKLIDNRQFIKELRKMYAERGKGLNSKSNKNTTKKDTVIANRGLKLAKEAQQGNRTNKAVKPISKGAVKN